MPYLQQQMSIFFQLLAASLFIGICAQIKIPLYFTPVPLTGQTFGVLLVSAFQGSQKGALATLLYLLEGCAGLPVWAGGHSGLLHLLGPTGGYRLAYVLQAYLSGKFLENQPVFSIAKSTSVLFFICCLQLGLGTLWLTAFVGTKNVFMMGFYPFIPIELAKSLIASIYLSRNQSQEIYENYN